MIEGIPTCTQPVSRIICKSLVTKICGETPFPASAETWEYHLVITERRQTSVIIAHMHSLWPVRTSFALAVKASMSKISVLPEATFTRRPSESCSSNHRHAHSASVWPMTVWGTSFVLVTMMAKYATRTDRYSASSHHPEDMCR